MAFAVTEGTIAGARPRTVDGSAAFGIDRLSGITTFLGRTLAYDAIYRTQPHVRTVVDFLARQVASTRLGLYERLADDAREELVDGAPAVFYRRPNPLRSRFAFYRPPSSSRPASPGSSPRASRSSPPSARPSPSAPTR
jgi:hypothetical protein